jgi:hypothetical protein
VFTCIEIEATAGTNFWVDFGTIRTVLAQKSRAVQLSFLSTIFEVKGMNFISVENPGPISKSSWSVFDQAKTLSFLLS